MAIPLQKGRGKVNEIKVEGKYEKEKEVIVHHEIGSPKWKRRIMTIFCGTCKENIRSRKGK